MEPGSAAEATGVRASADLMAEAPMAEVPMAEAPP